MVPRVNTATSPVQHRPHATGTESRPAPMTSIDLHATRSHQGDHPVCYTSRWTLIATSGIQALPGPRAAEHPKAAGAASANVCPVGACGGTAADLLCDLCSPIILGPGAIDGSKATGATHEP